MTFTVKEIFYSLQGEGAHAGRPTVFCRFTGCNLWSGREEDRHQAQCRFCDTDFIGTDGPNGGKYQSAAYLAEAIDSLWPSNHQHKYAIFTGGEPLLQLTEELVDQLHKLGYQVAIETNGTLEPPSNIDWICVSPKTTELKVTRGHELKVVYPQPDINLEQLSLLDFQHRFIQPMDDSNRQSHTLQAVQYCLNNPKWRLSLQTHKLLGIP